MNIPFSISIQVIVFVLTFFLALVAGPILIPMLKKLKFGQTVRDDGPRTHLKKSGTPTIGALIFLIPATIVTFAFSRSHPGLMPMMLVTLGFGIIGFLDDFIKIVKKRKDGLYPKQKTIGLLLVAAVYALYIQLYTDIGTNIMIPFTHITMPGWAVVIFNILVLFATTNAVNLTDGLDGLLSGVTLIVMVFFTVVAMTNSQWEAQKIFSAIIAGGCLGFLSFNAHPAKIFMGDTGSLALGGAVGALAITMRMPFILFVVGIIYVAEALSDIIQVASFKLRGKRVFKMAPIHHHFELLGWKETKVVAVFWWITLLFCFIGLLILKVF